MFEESTNVFVPYYRQASFKAEMTAYDETGGIDAALEKSPLEDAKAALDYYFENYNNGRPFILAGHSQGSALMRLALKEYFGEHQELLDRMVAAYILGYSITRQDLDEYAFFVRGGKWLLIFRKAESPTSLFFVSSPFGGFQARFWTVCVLQ